MSSRLSSARPSTIMTLLAIASRGPSRMMTLLVIVTSLWLSTEAVADSSRARQLFEEGQRLYHDSRYLEAADRFAAAFDLEADPAFIYNAAQAYRAGNACARAAAAYRTFEAAVPNPPEPDKLRKHVEDMDACAREQQLAPPPPEKVVPPPPPPPREPPASEPMRDHEPADAGRGKRRLGVALGVTGIALVGTAIWFSLEGRSLARQYDDACEGATEQMPCENGAMLVDFDRRGRRANIFATAGYIVGGAALAGGVALYVLGYSEQREALAVRPTPGGAMVTTGWTF